MCVSLSQCRHCGVLHKSKQTASGTGREQKEPIHHDISHLPVCFLLKPVFLVRFPPRVSACSSQAQRFLQQLGAPRTSQAGKPLSPGGFSCSFPQGGSWLTHSPAIFVFPRLPHFSCLLSSLAGSEQFCFLPSAPLPLLAVQAQASLGWAL